jgi:hypothetical protein
MTADAYIAASQPAGEQDRDALRQVLYERVCDSYHAVDDFRMKLLGLLPVATGTGVFLLLSGKAELIGGAKEQASDALLAIGVFGFLFTSGLFSYELFGIKKCHYLIVAGRRLEEGMREPGQFSSRPRELAGLINEPFASAVIYPASMAAWAFLALALTSTLAAGVLALAVFVVGCGATLYGAARIKEEQIHEDLIFKLIRDEGPMSPGDVRASLENVKPATPWLDKLRSALRRQRDWLELTVDRLKEQGHLEEREERLWLSQEAAFRVMSDRPRKERARP